MGAVVVGQLARDVVMVMERLPDAGSSGPVRERLEQLGGKGANQAVGLSQLGVPAALVAVAGDDPVGDALLARAAVDGVDVSHVVRRAGTPTGLIVEVLEDGGRWRYLEHLPQGVLLTEADVRAAEGALRAADAVLVQLQQPLTAVRAAVEVAGGLVVLDGVVTDRALLRGADVLRADARETAMLLGVPAREKDVLDAAPGLLDAGPKLLAFALEEGGDLFVWRGGHETVPHAGGTVVDTTGGGDALTAALTAALLSGSSPREAGRFAVAAAGDVVTRAGGRPAFTRRPPSG
ncbi:PfkB family carbohydrate kinase [Dactylosporangium sp. NBC_01737]|uniref:PfkB family carbohydrate kinase n=1 Tax=Dactylosporangium sp. NBC_01737 TaxID=2975959 RepID=UPI002E13CC63|nr:PfkB family carbohydrate kinase [Dactylosporangium sp. NBC_01737]